MKFNTYYTNRPEPVTCVPDTDTKFVDQSEADRAGLKYQIERFGMDSLLQQFEKTKAQFGYADTRLVKDFAGLCEAYAEANEYFMQLPAQLRKDFNHDPIQFYSSIEQDPSTAYSKGYISKALAQSLGVESAIDKPVESVDPVEVVEPTVNSEEVSA